MRKCKNCGLEKELNTDNFSVRIDKGRSTFRWECKQCRAKNSVAYKKKNVEKQSVYDKEYYQKNKVKNSQTCKKYRENHIEELKKYFRLYTQKKRKTNSIFRLRADVSTMIRRALKKNNGSKSGVSCFEILGYTVHQLKEHLEKQFELWMTWNNCGRYSPSTWDDNDNSTWIWQIDHIIPQSDLPYNSMEDDNFKKCWMLENLRPLSAKQNFLDGVFRKRHKNE